MNGPGISRDMRAKLRKSFPASAPDIATFDFAALAAWHSECGLQRMLAPMWTPARYRWRRAHTRAQREYSARLLAHRGAGAGQCDQCQTRPASMHVAYQPMEAPRFAHYCGTCGPGMPPGWMFIAQLDRQPTQSPVP